MAGERELNTDRLAKYEITPNFKKHLVSSVFMALNGQRLISSQERTRQSMGGNEVHAKKSLHD